MDKVNIQHNTLADALAIALDIESDAATGTQSESYGVVSIHRFENIFNRKRLTKIIELVELAAASVPLTFVLHPATRQALTRYGLYDRMHANPRIHLAPRMGYFEFAQLLKGARFVITDGGGNQEELSYLGIPTLLMRKATERQEGLQSTVTLCPYDQQILKQFLQSAMTEGDRKMAIGEVSPSKIIVEHLQGLPSKSS